MFFHSKPKDPLLSNPEKGCLASLDRKVNHTIKLRKGQSGTKYCLYDTNNNPLATWPRGVVEGLVLKNKLIIQSDGHYKIL